MKREPCADGSTEKSAGLDLLRIKRFVEALKREAEIHLGTYARKNGLDEQHLHFLEGKLEALKALWCYIDRLEDEERARHGRLSALSPQG